MNFCKNWFYNKFLNEYERVKLYTCNLSTNQP